MVYSPAIGEPPCLSSLSCHYEIGNVGFDMVTVIVKQILICMSLKICILVAKMSNTVANQFFDLHHSWGTATCPLPLAPMYNSNYLNFASRMVVRSWLARVMPQTWWSWQLSLRRLTRNCNFGCILPTRRWLGVTEYAVWPTEWPVTNRCEKLVRTRCVKSGARSRLMAAVAEYWST